MVSKRKRSPYRSGRSPDWLKMKNPNAPAGRRGLGTLVDDAERHLGHVRCFCTSREGSKKPRPRSSSRAGLALRPSKKLCPLHIFGFQSWEAGRQPPLLYVIPYWKNS
jgi:hypothetical protein